MPEFPERLDAPDGRAAFVLRRDLHAVHDWYGANAERAVHSIVTARVAAFHGPGAMPVYERGGQLAYPTGSVWVRFADGVDAKSRADALARAGYRIEKVPGYAPNGAFVTADDSAYALSHLDALRGIEGVERVEPQMLFAASSR